MSSFQVKSNMPSLVKKPEGLLYIISAPSGGGKTTVRDKLLEQSPDLRYSISCTTRKPRTGEIPGKDYYFISQDDFDEKVKRDEFLEYAQVFGASYGTPGRFIDDNLSQGDDVILAIDTQGALQIKAKRDPVLIFILPPSLEVLKGRLYNRKTDSESDIWKRLKEVRNELKAVQAYDYIVINDNIDTTVKKVVSIMMAEKCRLKRKREILQLFDQSIPEGL